MDCEDACLTVVEEGHKLIIGRDLFSSLSLAVVKQVKRGKGVNNIDNSTCETKQKTYVVKSRFHQKIRAKPQKGRREPINLQPRVAVKLDRLQKMDTMKCYLAALTNTLNHQ